MIRVAFVLPSFAGGGAERVMLTVLRGLDRTRFAVDLVVLDDAGPLAAMVPADCRVVALHRPRVRAALPALLRALRTLRPDVAVATMAYLNQAVLALRPLLPRSLRLVVREANMPLAGLAGTKRTLAGLGYRLLYPRADAVLAPAQRIADALAQRLPGLDRRLRVIANPVDEAAIRAAAAEPARTPGPGLRIVAAGRLTRQKGFDRLLALLAGMAADSHLTLLGDGPDRAALEADASRLGLERRVRFAGHLDAPWAVYAGADVFALPSRWEGLSNAALEALACGTPVVATPEAGGIAEIAAATAPGAVTIRDFGPGFAAALASAAAGAPAAPRPSLLPAIYRLDEVVGRYADLLATVARHP